LARSGMGHDQEITGGYALFYPTLFTDRW
jgi:hypothetical protein